MRAFVAELLGTAFLLAAIVGAGIMADSLAGGNAAIALLATTLAIGAALVALIVTFAPVSGAHLNPAVTLGCASRGDIPWTTAWGYVAAQLVGAVSGVGATHVMFDQPLYAWSQHARNGFPQAFSEAVATFGLLSVVWGCAPRGPVVVAFAVGAYIFAACWFTASTSFANPAVTIARALTDTFTGIRAADVPAFLAAQALGGMAATVLWRWLRKD